jgi:hypothetical protein
MLENKNGEQSALLEGHDRRPPPHKRLLWVWTPNVALVLEASASLVRLGILNRQTRLTSGTTVTIS